MTNETSFERLSEIQNEILGFTMQQVGDKVDKFYVQGKITDDARGNITGYEGNLRNVVIDGRVQDASDILGDAGFDESCEYIQPRVAELHDILRELQGKSPVRFRWAVDTKTGEVESQWTYYENLTDAEKKDDFWENWQGDFAWKAQLEAELAGQ
ncbi:hypothetical protein HQQ80_09245 [Microbacteriaceae bacterium VKM Ac-2855]|nr:hypothetical protein [Microbacteriaceae bacterium VKM Ac-2855]